jgi:hypothetical protein
MYVLLQPPLLTTDRSRRQDDVPYHTVHVHLLKQTDIRPTDRSLFLRPHCLSIHAIALVC